MLRLSLLLCTLYIILSCSWDSDVGLRLVNWGPQAWRLISWQSNLWVLDDNRSRVTCEGGDTVGWWHTWGNYSDIPAHTDHPRHRMSRPRPGKGGSGERELRVGHSQRGVRCRKGEWQDEHSWEVRIDMRDTSDQSVNTDITHQNDQNATCQCDTFVTFLTYSISPSYCD